MTKYGKEKTIDELRDKLSDIAKLYKAECINWTGITKDSKEEYSEIIAEELLRHLQKLRNIPSITRKKTYYTKNHSNIDINENNRKEENFAKSLYKNSKELETLGLIKDFQIPLKNIKNDNDKVIGKIDLISYNKNNKTLFLIELKYTKNKETLLKSILEIYTYSKIVDGTKLINDFELGSVNLEIIPCVLLAKGCKSYRELEEMESGKRPNLKKLSRELGIRFFTIAMEFSVNEIHL